VAWSPDGSSYSRRKGLVLLLTELFEWPNQDSVDFDLTQVGKQIRRICVEFCGWIESTILAAMIRPGFP
jgi:hypothetical protein